jgi:hypothetical protein
MRKATKTVATWLGIVAGIAGLEHGYFEILQGNTKPVALMFPSMGVPCVPEKVWNACEPAMSIFPNLLIAGILTVILGLIIMAWSSFFIQLRNGGLILILLCAALLLFGGGFFPPLIGIVGGAAGMKINKPIEQKQAEGPRGTAATFWPWPLVILLIWLLGQFPVGYFFNDFLKSIMGFGILLILSMLPLSVYAAYTYDVHMISKGA